MNMSQLQKNTMRHQCSKKHQNEGLRLLRQIITESQELGGHGNSTFRGKVSVREVKKSLTSTRRGSLI